MRLHEYKTTQQKRMEQIEFSDDEVFTMKELTERGGFDGIQSSRSFVMKYKLPFIKFNNKLYCGNQKAIDKFKKIIKED